ncbi:MAG: YHS domain-containing protein, partial [Bryobacteraceae bacterium]
RLQLSPRGDVNVARDMVCGMEVDEFNPPAYSDWEQHRYFFCSAECKRRFDENPPRYAAQGLSEGIKYPAGPTEPPSTPEYRDPFRRPK